MQAGALGAGRWGRQCVLCCCCCCCKQPKKDNPRRASLMAINYQPGAARLGWGAWHCHNLSDRRDLEHLGRRGGRRVETRRRGWPGPTTGSQGFQLRRFEAHPGVRGRCEARKTDPDWLTWPRLCPMWDLRPAGPCWRCDRPSTYLTWVLLKCLTKVT